MRYYKYLSILALSISLGSCSDSEDYTEFYDGVLALSNPGVVMLQSYNVGVEQTEDVFIQRGGFTTTASNVEMVVDESLVDSMSNAQGKDFELLPKECYEILTPTVKIEGNERLFKGQIKFNPEKILAINGNVYDKNKYILPIRMKSDGMPFVTGRSEIIYDFKVSEAIVTLLNKGVFPINGDVAKVNVGVPFVNQWDITATTSVDEGYVDSYNKTNNTYFRVLPKSCYSSEQKAILTPEKSSDFVEYKINMSKIKSGNFLLPIKIEGLTTDVSIKKDDKARTVFQFSKMGERVNKSDWEIDSFTTEEPSGEGSNNGRAKHLIDGDVNTFWHARWKGGSDPLPYEIVINMKKRVDIAQVEVLPRGHHSNNPIKVLHFYVSDDKANWEFIGEFAFTNIDDYLVYNVKKTAGKYLKLVLPDAGGNSTVAAIRELEVRGEVLN